MSALPFVQYKGAKPKSQTLLTVVSSGRPVADKLPAGKLASPLDLRRVRVDRYRQIVFHEKVVPGSSGKTLYLVNNHLFDPNYVPITMKLGSVEQWTIVNTDTEWHTFHIHQNPFQVVSLNGKPVNYIDWQDTVTMAPGDTVVIRMRPIDFTGKFVFHCHMIFHEDLHAGQLGFRARDDDGRAGGQEPDPRAAGRFDRRRARDRGQLERLWRAHRPAAAQGRPAVLPPARPEAARRSAHSARLVITISVSANRRCGRWE